jgi:hypothetical protein
MGVPAVDLDSCRGSPQLFRLLHAHGALEIARPTHGDFYQGFWFVLLTFNFELSFRSAP